jgi:NAD(P)-dependent dehydrogenase (short-subunit alcohol dehydrogenase family)
VLTTRKAANASALAAAIREQGGECMVVELDLVSQDSIAAAFATIRREPSDPDVLVYNAGYLEGRDLQGARSQRQSAAFRRILAPARFYAGDDPHRCRPSLIFVAPVEGPAIRR